MNKKQVTAFLKIVGKDKDRELLTNAYVDTYNDKLVLVGTNGFMVAAMYIDDAAEPLMGTMIRRDALERWARAATGRSRLTGEELLEVARGDYALNEGYYKGEYPNWRGVMPTIDKVKIDTITYNGEFSKILQDLDGGDRLTYEFYGELKPVVVRTDQGVYVMTPMTKTKLEG